MKFAAPFAVVAVVACAQLAGQQEQKEARAREKRCECAAPAVVERVTDERDACVAELTETKDSAANAAAAAAPRPRTRVVVKAAPVQAPAKRCAGEAPKIVAVVSEKCEGGRLCLDEKAQAALATNLAAYEKWVRDVQECERTP